MRWNEFKQKLKKQADVQPSLNGSLVRLWGTSRQLTDLADCCYKEGELEQAYIYYLRAANTLILHAPKHREFASASGSSKLEYKKLALKNLETLEDLAVILQEKWDAPTPEPEPSEPSSDQSKGLDSLESPGQQLAENDTNQPSSKDNELPSIPFAENKPHPANQADHVQSEYALPASIQRFIPSAPILPTPDALAKTVDDFSNLRLSQSKKPSFKSAKNQASILESINAVKNLSVPSDLPSVFSRCAQPNTSRNIETCGFLLGSFNPSSDIFLVTHLYIPPQNGTSDTVNVGADGDEATLNFAILKNLCILGWIHTHPSQECFLSSVDLHTQFIYQATQSSFIGIVLAPSFPKNSIGFFSVTDKGLSVLKNCSQDGFHRHSEDDGLYAQCKHVILDSNRKTTMVDGR